MKLKPNADDDFEVEELLPCPFCGGTAEVTFKGNKFTLMKSATVKCLTCLMQKTVGAIHNNQEWCARTAIKVWNTRITK